MTGSPMADIPLGVGKRLAWLRAHCQPDHLDCVLWPFAIGRNGYGSVFKARMGIGAHAEACEIVNGPKPAPHLEAAHSCGNRACINGHHLRWATSKENAEDRKAHGTYLSGEDANPSKLTNQQAREIFFTTGKQRDIAARYGVTQKVVGLIKARKTYRSALGMA